MKRVQPKPELATQSQLVMSNHSFEMLNDLLGRILQSLETDRAVMLLEQNGTLTREADVSYDQSKGVTYTSAYQLKSETGEEASLPHSIVRDALSNHKSLYLHNPCEDAKYCNDPYFKSATPSFIYCSRLDDTNALKSILYIESRAMPVAEDRMNLITVWRDQVLITLKNMQELAQLQEKLKSYMQATHSVKKQNQAKTRFLTDMNREVRVPLNSIVGFSELLMKKGAQLQFPAEVHQYLENIQFSSNRLTELLENVLNYSRVDSGATEVVIEEIQLQTALRSVYLANRQLLEQHQLSMKMELSDDLPHLIHSDRSLFTNCLLILSRFCIKRSPQKKQLQLTATGQKDKIKLRIDDAGNPIPDALIKDLFTPFSSEEQQQLAPYQTSTLDLAIAKQMVERLQGTLSYHANPTSGAYFEIILPINANRQAIQKPATLQPDKHDLSDYTALLLEKPNTDWSSLLSMLQELHIGFVIQSYSQSPAPETNIDLIITEIDQADISSQIVSELLKRCAEPELASIPLIAVTTDKHFRPLDEISSNRPVEYLVKPYGLQDVMHHLTAALALETLSSRGKRQNKTKLAEIPDLDRNQSQMLVSELETLKYIPIFKGGTIIHHLKRLNEIGGLSKQQHPNLIDKLKLAVFEGNAHRFQQTIDKAISGIKKRSQ